MSWPLPIIRRDPILFRREECPGSHSRNRALRPALFALSIPGTGHCEHVPPHSSADTRHPRAEASQTNQLSHSNPSSSFQLAACHQTVYPQRNLRCQRTMCPEPESPAASPKHVVGETYMSEVYRYSVPKHFYGKRRRKFRKMRILAGKNALFLNSCFNYGSQRSARLAFQRFFQLPFDLKRMDASIVTYGQTK